jgi:myo-inositol-1(or 4)-monophosphatase
MDFLEHALNITRDIAVQAGYFLLQNLQKRKYVRIKHSQREDLVTWQDLASQRMILQKLTKEFPGHDFLAEEAPEDRSLSRYRWFIDPLDGTTNYVHGFPVFCVSIALEIDARVMLGVVYNPNLDELFYAIRGRGAFKNRRRLRVSRTKDLRDALLATGFPYDLKRSLDNNLDYFNAYIMHAKAIRRAGSAALDLCYTACGIFDGFWEIKLGPWDMAAGALIAKEAGARVTDLMGKEFDLFSGEILATNGLIHSQMVRIAKSVRTT